MHASGFVVAILATGACASHHGVGVAPQKWTFRPALHVGDWFRYHVVATIDATSVADGVPQRSHATLELDDRVEVVGASQVFETFENPLASGEGNWADAVKRIAPTLVTATVTTSFDANWQIASTAIAGSIDDDARTLIMNLTPVVSFRLLPKDAVAIGDTWLARWNEALRSERESAAGTVGASVHYALRGVAKCRTEQCATFVGDGRDDISEHDGVNGTSTFHGEQVVGVADVVPISKTVASKTVLNGNENGHAVQYTNTTTVRVQRIDR
jgi:hypothetical protein